MVFVTFNDLADFTEHIEREQVITDALHLTYVFRTASTLPLRAVMICAQIFDRPGKVIYELVLDCGEQMIGERDSPTIDKGRALMKTLSEFAAA